MNVGRWMLLLINKANKASKGDNCYTALHNRPFLRRYMP